MSAQSRTLENVRHIYEMPLMDLIHHAQTIHRAHHDPNQLQLSRLLNIKKGACPENCAYCAQSGHNNTELEKEKLMSLEDVITQAKQAKEDGCTRFCLAAAWRSPPKKDLPKVAEMVKAIKDLGLESCVTLGMLDGAQTKELKEAGLDYYNHNLDSSPEFYEKIITSHTYQDRLNTIKHVQEAGIHVCSGGILGMGESREDRIGLLHQLINLPVLPKSVTINQLIAFKGTPLEQSPPVDSLEYLRTVATARVFMPEAYIRLCGGRETLTEELQTLCFVVGANSLFFGGKLLVAENREADQDTRMFEKINFTIQTLDQTEPA